MLRAFNATLFDQQGSALVNHAIQCLPKKIITYKAFHRRQCMRKVDSKST